MEGSCAPIFDMNYIEGEVFGQDYGPELPKFSKTNFETILVDEGNMKWARLVMGETKKVSIDGLNLNLSEVYTQQVMGHKWKRVDHGIDETMKMKVSVESLAT